ncbi:hypothetical protein SAMN06296036_13546 [Pseudobacteriovorax antillogorgiicola]|uniref:Uncharacterized protein n=1 Tax=Pseudobacteriovorax antillogorgiicola TaxID=1513793 RepID=A0A1Y6CNW3_9BACT|nr:hypothetical protein EDD56_13445 [Pseudobacteriovorax antillogorgiicola]SMF80712.1 hypothetical protein SAMN06296036_13546 [Pseudobacteriovorax antillogorgiicola]
MARNVNSRIEKLLIWIVCNEPKLHFISTSLNLNLPEGKPFNYGAPYPISGSQEVSF